jgi:hypothetical protein
MKVGLGCEFEQNNTEMMRLFLGIVGAFLAAVIAFFAIYRFPRVQLVSSLPLMDVVALIVNIAIFLLTLISLCYAAAAYQYAIASGAEQQKTLESTRKALEQEVATTDRQRQLLDTSLSVLSEHLSVVKKQWEAEKERLARKPVVEISLGTLTPAQLLQEPTIPVLMQDSTMRFEFIVKNVGNAPAVHPTVIFVATPASVRVNPPGVDIPKQAINVLQMSGNREDLVPYEIAQIPYSFQAEAKVPNDIPTFDLEFYLFAQNLAKQVRRVRITISREHKVVQPTATP